MSNIDPLTPNGKLKSPVYQSLPLPLDMNTMNTEIPKDNRTGRSRRESAANPRSSSTSASGSASGSGSGSAINRSPLRTPNNHHYTTQKLRNPSFSSTQRRPSVSSVGDSTIDFSTSIGMPYQYAFGGSSTASLSTASSASSTRTAAAPGSGSGVGTASPHPSLTTPIRHSSSRGSPRAATFDYTFPSRRHSDHIPLKPNTAEVFDLMEREQDAIVLKLMREIAQLKEDNRNLVNTVNQLTNNSYPISKSSTRSNSIATADTYELNSLRGQAKKKLKNANDHAVQNN